jgi:glucose-6-phosphate 1-dehydrogenase
MTSAGGPAQQSGHQAEPPTVFVLFGATGDLAKRMVLPAFFSLAQQGLLPENYLLVGNGRGDVSHEDFQGHVHDVLREFGADPEAAENAAAWAEFSSRLRFAGGGFDGDDPGSLLDVLAEARQQEGGDQAQMIHYFAVPPVAFGENTRALGQHGLAKGARVVYEKPFGTSPETFRQLNDTVHQVLDESQVFRIDHFLGKEATQNLHVLRFANSLIGDAWSNQHVRAVQIDVPETLDIADRAKFYDATGAFLDMIVTHLLQVAAEVAMETPASLSADDLQSARETVIGQFRPLDPAEVVFGQFDGYRDVEGIDPASEQDTFAACRLWIDNDRWRGVPFYLRTGKRLAGGAQRVSLLLREPEQTPFDVPADQGVLTFDLKGKGGIDLSLVIKEPGTGLELTTSTAAIQLAEVEGGDALEPYARLINDVLQGDRSLFTRSDGLAAAWTVVEPVLQAKPAVQPYAPGSWGPQAAADLIAPDRWLVGQ